VRPERNGNVTFDALGVELHYPMPGAPWICNSHDMSKGTAEKVKHESNRQRHKMTSADTKERARLSSAGFSSLHLIMAAGALAIVSASPSMAQVTFAQYDQTNGSIQQWTLSEATASEITTTTIAATGAVEFMFGGVPGLPFSGVEAATFTLNATTIQTGQCNTSTCANGNSFDQAGYSGTFSFIDAGSDPGANLLSGTFTIAGNPSQTGGSFGAQIGANEGTFTASTDATNVAQVVFTSAFLSFAGETSETASWSLSSLKDLLVPNGFATTTTTNRQAYPNQTSGAAGDGTFSTAVPPVAATPEGPTFGLIGCGLLGLGLWRRTGLSRTN
jgi:hypothetical protein